MESATETLDAGGPQTPDPVSFPPEEAIQRYTDRESLGEGGMGLVLRATDERFQRPVAMKVLSKDGAEARARFLQEAQVNGQLDHPAILPVYDLGQTDGRPFFTMKLIPDHDTLSDVIKKLRDGDAVARRHYTFERRVAVVQQVLHALAYAHARGVVHRDVKPSNVVVGPFGEVYLLDWGVAKVEVSESDDEERAPVATEHPHETQDGAVVGTPAYMAPEQVMEGQGDAVADVYSTCAVLYELLTLRYYLGPGLTTTENVLTALVARVPRQAEAFRDPLHGRVPRALSRVLERGLQKKREDRYGSAEELASALQWWLEGRAPIVCPGTCMQRMLSTWSYWVDQHPFVVPMASLVIVLLFARWVITGLWRLGEWVVFLLQAA